MRLLEVDPGFRIDSAAAMDLSLPSSNDEEKKKQVSLFYRQLLERLEQLPGVVAAGGINSLPMTGTGANGTFLIDNNPAQRGNAEYRRSSAGYFAAMGIPLLRGRLFEPADGPDSPHVAVISRSLAQKVWPGEDPIGKRIQFGNMDRDKRLLHIVGIVGDVRDRGLELNAGPTVYANALQRPQSSYLSVVVRAQADPSALIPSMRQTVRDLNPELPVNFRTLEQLLSSSLDRRRFSLVIFGVFAVVALLLAVTGVYGMMTYAVSQRAQEIGVRMALGATVRDILRLIISRGLKLIVLGIVLGVGGALALSRLLMSLLFGVSATDPITFAGVAALLSAAALPACYVPARSAAKVDPMIVLRRE
jgi:putative ABC transport system permease protein